MASQCKKRKSLSQENSYSLLHPKNPFKDHEPDIRKLCFKYPSLLMYCVEGSNARYIFNWKEPGAQKLLTNVLMQENFNFQFDIPDNHLCPPLPNRINYLCWLSDLLKSEVNVEIKVMDIGVGPLCVYPILGNKLFKWKFYGSDIDKDSVDYANKNILIANSNESIQVHIVNDCEPAQKLICSNYVCGTTGLLFALTSSAQNVSGVSNVVSGPIRLLFDRIESHVDIDAVMTNPPFYTTDEEIFENSHSVCSGSVSEMRTFGGEVAFICAMIADSLILTDSIGWYTAMIGKKSSLLVLRNVLLQEGLPQSQIFSTVFRQGVTSRWGLAWTFRPNLAIQYARSCETCELTFETEMSCDLQQISSTQTTGEIFKIPFDMVVDRISSAIEQSCELNRTFCFKRSENDNDVLEVEYALMHNLIEPIGKLRFAISIAEQIKIVMKFCTVGYGEFPSLKSFISKFRTNFENNFFRCSRKWRRKLTHESLNSKH